MVKKVGIIGAGVMGCGVAQTFSEYGFNVILVDKSDDVLHQASMNIHNACRLRKFQGINIDICEILGRINFTTQLDKIEECDYIVENVSEDVELKLSLYPCIDKICRKNIIIAANTSCISITKLAAVTSRKENIIGIHFMNPVPSISAVEVIRGFYTSEETIRTTKDLMEQICKECIVVNDMPGFVSNRISHLMMNEAAFIVQDNVAKAEDIDAIFCKCYGHKMGPLETADLIGLDTVVKSLDVLYKSYQDSKFRCCPLLNKMVDAGLLGRKSGEGFYKYN